ncbi:2,3,4,5-tetrahydropyridine-2,6-dicarboxylate N-acetyltransferase [Dyadobacter sp. CECT 9275]|uniref:2,3,4,5-tetrahydropyridine-2,6-dicarboxylate N-acetyltransferase n=1 Tax=Dyadobacter helix TaxID=2822344 RepID=A0A916JG80_9BACT|nr:acyltransferase [Dyadobacter sp. CECT 9275]CAG5008003.1 2,3,4,5-tetrahydropyridine-2,6-dicarboxylate N-acetyltransferase [Dyadobacter sp. CECT 9275]
MKKLLVTFYISVLALKDYLYREWLLHLPLHFIRLYLIKKTLYKVGKQCFFAIGIETRQGRNITVGNNCVVNKRVLLDGRGGKIILGNNVDIAQEVNIWTLSHDPHSDYHETTGADVIIQDYVWIASRVTILPGVHIGKGAVVATGSVVTSDVGEMVIVAGIPAKPIGLRKSKLLYTLDHRPWFR